MNKNWEESEEIRQARRSFYAQMGARRGRPRSWAGQLSNGAMNFQAAALSAFGVMRSQAQLVGTVSFSS